MTREDIVRMAKEAGMESFNICVELDDFAKIVAEHEREACAKIADEWAVGWPHPSKVIALDIRARSKE